MGRASSSLMATVARSTPRTALCGVPRSTWKVSRLSSSRSSVMVTTTVLLRSPAAKVRVPSPAAKSASSVAVAAAVSHGTVTSDSSACDRYTVRVTEPASSATSQVGSQNAPACRSPLQIDSTAWSCRTTTTRASGLRVTPSVA